MRKRTGLRNRFRQGSGSTYNQRRRSNGADSYGQWQGGVQTRDDAIAGRLSNHRQHMKAHG